MKEFLKKLIKKKEDGIKAARAALIAETDAEKRAELGETLDGLYNDLDELKARLADAENEGGADDGEGANGEEGRSQFNPVASYTARGSVANQSEREVEARVAFANFVTRGVRTPEMRATTNTANTAAAIPQNLVAQIIEKIEAVGMILPLVTRTAYPVGQSIPTDSTKPTASWVNEGAGSTPIAKGTLGSIVFGAFKLRCEIRMTQEVTVQTIAAFEALFVKQVSEAMVKAIESKIVSEDAGANSPAGILYDAAGEDAKVEIIAGADGVLDYNTLVDAEAALPQQYESGAKWFMSKKTFMGFVGMVDTVGQPIARVNYGIGGKPERVLLGRDVVLTGAYLPDFAETVSADTCFGFLFDPSDYVLNTSYDLGIQRKNDWDTEDECVKAVMSVDGKVIDRNSLVKLIKKA